MLVISETGCASADLRWKVMMVGLNYSLPCNYVPHGTLASTLQSGSCSTYVPSFDTLSAIASRAALAQQ